MNELGKQATTAGCGAEEAVSSLGTRGNRGRARGRARADRILYPAPRFPPRQTLSAPPRPGPGAEHDGPHRTRYRRQTPTATPSEQACLILIFRGVGSNGDSPPALSSLHQSTRACFSSRRGRGTPPRRNGKGHQATTMEKQPPAKSDRR